MLKAVGNLIIILLIGIAASGISVFYSPTLVSNTTWQEENDMVNLIASTSEDELLLNPKNIYIKYRTDKNTILYLDKDYQFTATIFKNDEVYKNFNIHENIPLQIEFTKDTPYSVNIDISQDRLELPNGNYMIQIKPNIVDGYFSTTPIELNVRYLSDVPYFPATNSLPEGKLALKLYFIDSKNSVEQLIGITRFIDYTNMPLNTLMTELRNGPTFELGLKMNPIIGEYNYVSLKGTTAYVDLPSSESLYTEDPERSEIAMNSLIKSLTSYPGVENVKFLVDYNKAETFFNGKDVSQPYSSNNINMAYLAYNSSTRYFLVECAANEITEEMSLEEKVKIIFNMLQNNICDYLSPTVPSEVELLNSWVDNDVLVLNFNSQFLKAYGDNDNLNRMMLDSILYSFSSLENVNKLRILVEGEAVDNFANFDLSNDVMKPLFLNPEM